MKSGFILLLLLVFIISAGRAMQDTAQEAQTIGLQDTLPMDQAIIHGQLKNGLTYYIRQNHKPEKLLRWGEKFHRWRRNAK